MLVSEKCNAEVCSWVSRSWYGVQVCDCRERALTGRHTAAVLVLGFFLRSALWNILCILIVAWYKGCGCGYLPSSFRAGGVEC